MLLSVQIAIGVAAGILIAYVLIFHRDKLAKGAKELVLVVFALLVVMAIGFLITSIPKTIVDNPPIWGEVARSAGMLLTVALAFAGAALSAVGFRTLVYEARRKPVRPLKQGEGSPHFKWAALNFMLVAAVTFTLPLIGAGGWIKAVDQYGRSIGVDDGLSVLLFVSLMLWPFPILGALRLMRRMRKERTDGEAIQEA